MPNAIQTYSNDALNANVRAFMDEGTGEPMFVAADVAKALGYGCAKDMTRRLDDDEKGGRSVPTPGGLQTMTCITEPGLYSAVLGSKLPTAKAFKRWVTHDVLPAIRRNGGYMAARPGETREQRPPRRDPRAAAGPRPHRGRRGHAREGRPHRRAGAQGPLRRRRGRLRRHVPGGRAGQDDAPERRGGGPEPPVRVAPRGRLPRQERLQPQRPHPAPRTATSAGAAPTATSPPSAPWSRACSASRRRPSPTPTAT